MTGKVFVKSLRNGANDGFWVPVTDLPGTLRFWPWTKCEIKMVSLALGGIFFGSQETKCRFQVIVFLCYPESYRKEVAK